MPVPGQAGFELEPLAGQAGIEVARAGDDRLAEQTVGCLPDLDPVGVPHPDWTIEVVVDDVVKFGASRVDVIDRGDDTVTEPDVLPLDDAGRIRFRDHAAA